jgi:hypothetical protein
MKPQNVTLVVSAFLFMICLLASCSKPSQTVTPQKLSDSPPFNPDYFRSYDRHYYALKIEFKEGKFQLAERKVYKLPGRILDFKKFPKGNFKISYFANANQLIEEVTTLSPLEAIKEKDFSSVNDTTLILLDSATFFIPLHTSNQTRMVQIDANGFLPLQFPVPADTVDLIANNQQLVPDTSWSGGKQPK